MENRQIARAIEKHFDAVKHKRIDEILELYAESDELLVFVEGPRWQTLGYANVEKGWRDFVNSEIVVRECVWAENLRTRTVGKMGFVAGIARLEVEIKGEMKTIEFRGTFVLEENEKGSWKIIHEHFSQPAENPYGIGDWLKTE
jgi:ketosteroid isomerase-like protein